MSANKHRLRARFTEQGLPFGLFAGMVLIGVSAWWSWITIVEWQKDRWVCTWPQVDCEIVSSGIVKARKKGKDDLFTVRYVYQWQGRSYDCNCYCFGYDGDQNYYPSADYLEQTYRQGERNQCFVNPDDPNQAVLKQQEPLLASYLIIPAFLLLLGGRQLSRAYRSFVKGQDLSIADKEAAQQSSARKAAQVVWKWATRIGLVFALLVGFWFVFFIAVFFIVVPYLFLNAMREQFKDMGKELVKMEGMETTNQGKLDAPAKRVQFTVSEKVAIGIAAAIYLLLMFLIARNHLGRDRFTLLGILLNGFWLFGFMALIVWAIVAQMHEYHYEKVREKIPYRQQRRSDFPVWSLMISNLVVIIWAIADKWSLFTLMGVYWSQSIIIGLYWFLRILSLREYTFDKESFFAGTTRKNARAFGFIAIYLIFHAAYAAVMPNLLKETSERLANVMPIILAGGGIFLANQIVCFIYDLIRASPHKPNVDKMIGYAFMRVLPMHLTIMGAGFLQGVIGVKMGGAVTLALFLGLKTLADVAMYLQGRRGFVGRDDTQSERQE